MVSARKLVTRTIVKKMIHSSMLERRIIFLLWKILLEISHFYEIHIFFSEKININK